MAGCGIISMSIPMGGRVSICSTSTSISASSGSSGGRAPIGLGGGVEAIRACRRKCSLSTRLVSELRGGPRGGRVFVRQGVESAKDDISVLYPKIASTGSPEFKAFQSRRWSDAARDELAVLKNGGWSSREAFANTGEITELNMEGLVDSLLKEEGQSIEDYQHRATFFNLIAEFFRQGKAYSAEIDEPRRDARTMQILVDSILAEDGRSATDYNARAQFFAKSAKVFPFKVEVRQI